jgi:uncharacterized protein
MATDDGHTRELRNDTAINVAGLLKGPIGTTRNYHLVLDRFDADSETSAREIEGSVRLTRLRDGVMATVRAGGVASQECARCLRDYDQPFAVAFDEEYRQTVDLRTGVGLAVDLEDGEQTSLIDENHELDLREPLRQEMLIALPMRPDCGPDCPGPGSLQPSVEEEVEAVVDARLAALASLLGDDQGSA